MVLKYKTIIAPIIAVVAMTLQLVFGIELNQELQGEIVTSLANIIAVGFVVYGIFHNHFTNK